MSEFSSGVAAACNVVADVPDVELAVGRRLSACENRFRRAPDAVVVRGAA